jgi:hypothetical protein
MEEVLLWKVLDFALSAVAAGIERQVVLDKVAQLELEGKSRSDISKALCAMRDEAINAAGSA